MPPKLRDGTRMVRLPCAMSGHRWSLMMAPNFWVPPCEVPRSV